MFELLPLVATKQVVNEKNIVLSFNLSKAHVFTNANEVFNYVIQSKEKCFYEVLSENRKRKMYFDIDIENKDIVNVDKIIKNCVQAIVDIIPNSICMITKSQNDESKKCGIHIIILNYVCKNVYECKRLFYTIQSKIDEQYHKFIDDQVYKSCQQFRTLLSSKYGQNRPKKFYMLIADEKFNHLKTDLEKIFKLSLISNCESQFGIDMHDVPDDCFDDSKIPTKTNIKEQLDKDEHIKICKRAVQLCKENKDLRLDLSCFEFKDVKEVFINLRRLRASFCVLCNRVHQHENAFLFKKENMIYYNCRRNNTSLQLGYFETPDEIQNVEKTFKKYNTKPAPNLCELLNNYIN